ncbi:LysE family transporter [Microbacterium sp. A93]|uniref:LysE family transporter n=1 Tax=unclassified Microbacterium TaxID=2609290 RepID=UPI003F435718
MTLTVWLSLLTASVIISFTPGAGAINTMSNSLAVGWRRSFWGVVGLQVALIVHVVIVAAGVGLIVASSPLLFNVIRYAGSAYLAYLGLRLIFARTAPDVEGEESTPPLRQSRWSMMRRGFWVNLLNPKAIVFFLAFIPQFIRVDQPALPQYLILVITVILVDVIVMWGFYATAAKPFRRVTHTARGQRALNVVFGALFLAVAALLLFIH